MKLFRFKEQNITFIFLNCLKSNNIYNTTIGNVNKTFDKYLISTI